MQRTVLIVEDNEVNLELMLLLLEQYSSENNTKFNILTATNGKKGVDLCRENKVDLVFMDIMMPTMNGTEATKIIKANHPKTMVIVISTLGDEAKQKEMLRYGAEDYMTKPINAPLFKSRLHNYLQLIEHRNHIDHAPKAKNLFTTKVYNYHIDFSIGSEASLAEFWEAMLIRLDFQRFIDNLSDFTRFIYRTGMIQLQKNFQFHIYIEEDESNFYFSLDNIKLIGCERVEKLIQKFYPDAIYLCQKNMLTFVLFKSNIETAIEDEPRNVVVQQEPTVTPQSQSVEMLKYIKSHRSETLQTFDILDEEELEDFENYINNLRSLMLIMENSSLEHSDIEQICHSFEELSSITSMSNDTYVISTALKNLASTITQNEAAFEEHADQLFVFINAFINDLIFWKNKIFYEGAPSVDFLNDSITTNANMFTALLTPSDDSAEDLDDIFDF